MSVAIIIPARHDSTRLPGKPLADINGKPLVEWVFDACRKVKNVEHVIVATDHKGIEKTAKQFKAKVFMTSADHQSGTDRCAEVAKRIDSDIIINVQGDEPFIDPKQLDNMINVLNSNPKIDILTLFHEISGDIDVADPSKVKLTKTIKNQILYFSRSVIPHERQKTTLPYYKHVGIYAFRRNVLLEISKLLVSDLERTEGLEQLRWMENGYKIHGLEIDSSPLGIDTPEDLERARGFARSHY